MIVVAQAVPAESAVEAELAASAGGAVSVVARAVPAVSAAARVEIVEVIVLTTKNHVATEAQ
mgnify:CR=1 FL=1